MVHPPESDSTGAGAGPGKRDGGPPTSTLWPPIIYVAAAASAVVLNQARPLGEPVSPPLQAARFAVLAAKFALDCSAMLPMRRNHANILPHRAATNLVTTWPFSVSRNPIVYRSAEGPPIGVGVPL